MKAASRRGDSGAERPTARPRIRVARRSLAASAAIFLGTLSLNGFGTEPAAPDPATLPDWTGPLVYRGMDWVTPLAENPAPGEAKRRLEELCRGAESLLRLDPARYRRAMRLEDIPPEDLDGRAAAAGKNRELFALAASDCALTHRIHDEGVRLAVAARCTGRADLLERALAVLSAAVELDPLQRPGWTAYEPDAELPPEGDGVWLATHWGISGIVDMLAVLGDRVPPDLRARLRAMLRREALRVVKDWGDRRPWYVRSRAVISNQWIEPSLGLIKACLYLGEEDLRPAYNLGARNLAASLAASGADGAFFEGVGYARMTLGSLFDTLEAMSLSGDPRMRDFPFVRRCWFWLVHMHLPGPSLLNAYDSGSASLPDWARRTPFHALAAAVRSGGDPRALQAVAALFPEGSGSLYGIRYAAALAGLPAKAAPVLPAPYAFFPSQRVAVWRERFEPPAGPQTALAVWVRGGSPLDGHAHRDQGQVSVQRGDRAIWMDCGTPAYSDPELETHYARASGHNILQIGELYPRSRPVDAPMTVRALDASGGHVQVDTAAAYLTAERCFREVRWSRDGRVQVVDRTRLEFPASAGAEWYRFHTGSPEPVRIEGGKREWTVRWPGAEMKLASDRPIRVVQESWPDRVQPPFRHAVVRILAQYGEQELALSTTLTVE